MREGARGVAAHHARVSFSHFSFKRRLKKFTLPVCSFFPVIFEGETIRWAISLELSGVSPDSN
jgi:hypothetical protein